MVKYSVKPFDRLDALMEIKAGRWRLKKEA